MNLSQVNIPFLVLNVNLKTGLITGVLGISLVTGSITLVNNYEEINKKIGESVAPVVSFLNPYFTQFHTGVINIGSKTRDWAVSFKNKPSEIWTWLEKNAEFSKIISGATQIQTKLSDWYPSIKNSVSSTANWLSELNYEKLKDYSRAIYKTIAAISKLIDQFSTILEKILEQMQKNPQGVNAENSLLNSLGSIMQSDNGMSTFQNLAKTFMDNSNRLSDLEMEDIAAVIGMAANQETNFNSKIKELSENTSGTSGERWGHYTNKEKFLEALGLKNIAQKSKLVQEIVKITKCPENKDCGSNYDKIINDFFESIKQVIQNTKDIENTSAIIQDLTLEKYLEESEDGKDNKTKQIINKLIELVSKNSK